MSPSLLESAAAVALAAQIEAAAAGNLVDAYRARLVEVMADAADPDGLVAALTVAAVNTSDHIVVFTDGQVNLAVTATGVALVAMGEGGDWEASADVSSAATLGAALAGQPAPAARTEG